MADEKNISRIHKEKARLQQQMAVTEDEYSKISAINSAVREQLLGEQDKAFKMEESLKVYKSYYLSVCKNVPVDKTVVKIVKQYIDFLCCISLL